MFINNLDKALDNIGFTCTELSREQLLYGVRNALERLAGLEDISLDSKSFINDIPNLEHTTKAYARCLFAICNDKIAGILQSRGDLKKANEAYQVS
jgi:hypothetical protein